MRLPFVVTALVLLVSAVAKGQQNSAEILLDNLDNPCGVAIQPGTGEIFVAESGEGRVFRVSNNKPSPVIEDFPVEPFELDRKLNIGPLGILFRGTDTLIVGTGGSPDGEDAIAIFDLSEIGKDPLKADAAIKTLKLEATDDHLPEGDFFSLVLTAKSLYAIGNGDPAQGWLAKSNLAINEVKSMQRFIPTTKRLGIDAPGGLTISPEGQIVVAQMGTRETAGDSVLAFFDSQGVLLDMFPTGLNDIVALAYSPRRKHLFALDFSWEDPAKGGLYQLVAVDSANGCQARLITQLKRPTAMTFDRDGNLYVTSLGIPLRSDAEVPDFENTGQLAVIRKLD